MCSAAVQFQCRRSVLTTVLSPVLKTRVSGKRTGILSDSLVSPAAFGLGTVRCRTLSSGEAFTALKPFFFAVHPDLFGQYPRERAVNENSLKQLNAYIESAVVDRPLYPTQLTFYVRNPNVPELRAESPIYRVGQFPAISVVLKHKDVRKTVHSILEKCNLPTAFIDSIQSRPTEKKINIKGDLNSWKRESYWGDFKDTETVKEDIASQRDTQDSLRIWLERHVVDAQKKLQDCWPIREEIVRLRRVICDSIGVKDVLWECGWGTRHFRGCLQSFIALASHHPESMHILKGKTIIFGGDTGVSSGGNVILNSGEVRANWYDLIKRVSKHNDVILRLPSVEQALSGIFKDIKVVHRKFEPTRMADSYESHLRKLITSIGDYRGRCKFPSNWPENLSHLELVVETDSGPLMLSPTGQIIVPSSCPPFLLVNFVSEHMNLASEKLEQYKREKYTEKDLHKKCVEELELVALEKADNITPNLMISCLGRLISRADDFKPILKGSHLWITTYYSVLTDGEMCIPWNWK